VLFIAASCPVLSSAPYLATHDLQLVLSGEKKIATSEQCAYTLQLPGSSCKFFCPAGYVLKNGLPTAFCKDEGIWSQSIPV